MVMERTEVGLDGGPFGGSGGEGKWAIGGGLTWLGVRVG